MIKKTILILLVLVSLGCKEEKKPEDKEKLTKEELFEIKRQEKLKEKQTDKDIIKSVLDSKSDYAYHTGSTGINTFVYENNLYCFLETNKQTEALYSDVFIVNIFSEAGKKSLSFEYIDFEKNDIDVNGKTFMYAVFDLPDISNASSIQVGQYSKTLSKLSWSVIIPKGRFH